MPYLLLLLMMMILPHAWASNHTVNLVVDYKSVNFSGKAARAIAINQQIPAPTLRFKEHDHIVIRVLNHLDRPTSIHWHGLLVPWQMDGVEGISQKPIPPGGVFRYAFTLRQAGTYWYHAHSGMQEQQGVYGAFIIDPANAPAYKYNKDYTVVLSDWNDARPEQTLANLKKMGDFYSTKLPLQPSLAQFIEDYRSKKTNAERKKIMDAYAMMQQMRMSIYDISDVAYDALLFNGRTKKNSWIMPVQRGDVVRLRFIGAGASTIFHVKIPGTTMQVVHVQGNDVKPYTVDDFTLAPGETLDVLVKIKNDIPYMIYAAAPDGSGAAYGTLTTHADRDVDYAQIPPFPKPEPIMMMHSAHGTHAGGMHSMHEMHANHTEQHVPVSSGTKYQNLKAAHPTNDPNKPAETITMELQGYMNRYMWFINGIPEHKSAPIKIEPGKRYRFSFTNTTMMHHPMHIHGHFFILRNGHGAYDPLLHTIEVPPGATVYADVDAIESGQWFFHCHHMYHMMSGMARVIQYTTIESTLKPNQPQHNMHSDHSQQNTHQANQEKNSQALASSADNLMAHPIGHPTGLYGANFIDIGTNPFEHAQKLSIKSLYGSDEHKLQLYMEDAEIKKGRVENADLDIFYWHMLDEFWAIKGGVNYFYRPSKTPYWQPGIGIEGLMPYFIETNVRAYWHDGSAKLDVLLSRDSQISHSLFIRTGIRSILASKTVVADEIGHGLNQMRYIFRPYFKLNPNVALFAEYEYQKDYGRLRKLRHRLSESTQEHTWTFGLAVLF